MPKDKGSKELARMKKSARAATPKVTDSNFATGAHPDRGSLADEQLSGVGGNMGRASGPVLKQYENESPPGEHDDK